MAGMGRVKPPSDTFPPPPDAWVHGDPKGPPLVVIVGPTGAGKSGLAMGLAAENRGAIVSADSRQVYEGFDIGTATPSADELARVPHDLVSCVPPSQTYTVAAFQADARAALSRRKAEGYLPMLVGGTGLYVRAVLDGLTIPPQAPDPALREELAALANPWAALAEVDPETAARLHPNDRLRIVRALEVHRLTGSPISAQQRTLPCPYRLMVIGVAAPRADLYRRIDARVVAMREAGLLDEVQALAGRWGWDHPLLGTLGYAEMASYLRGERSLPEATAAMAQHTRNYAKRQLTWFRADRRIRWLVRQPGEPDEQLVETASRWLRAWALA
ncbi:MAG: tRNA (adenosine(37)-N6)-dimethylallyltransferase MiaA [Candidatus Sericytochromatia bacterium]|nr:tRNA (adenosine(37)-N6)-dimethylallyltransferase MiaA [Candidatus Sericytochromatia bacterium]